MLKLFPIALALAAATAFSADIDVIAQAAPSGKKTVSVAAISGVPEAVKTFSAVLADDLKRSGWFTPVAGAQAAVVLSGEVSYDASSKYRASVAVTFMGGARREFWGLSFAPDKMRDAAHALADFVTEKVEGKPGMASSKILFVGRQGAASEIYQCDADGQRVRRITSDGKLCMSPAWFHNENAFLYTSWLSGFPAIYKVNLNDNRRELVASYPGMNQGASPSPDDRLMALVLSRSGGVDLWVQNLETRKLNRVTASKGVNEASPAWSPNGENIVFTSDEGGLPRVHMMSVMDKTPRRLVRSSVIRESSAPEWGADGRIVFCGRVDGAYKIFVTDASGSEPVLVSPDDGAHYEDPSWAPDNRHIVCTRTSNYQRSLVILDTLGDLPQQLLNVSGEWYLPQWSRKNTPLR